MHAPLPCFAAAMARVLPLIWVVISAGYAMAAAPTGAASALLERPHHPPLLFLRASGGGSQTQVTEHEVVDEQGQPVVKKIPGTVSWNDLTLERPLDDRTDLWQWRQQVESAESQTAREDVLLTFLDLQGLEIARRRFTNAWPRSLQAAITSATGAAPTEILVLAHEGGSHFGLDPQVSLLAPADGAVIWNATALVVRAMARLPDRVARVEIFAGASPIGVASPSGTEFLLTWTNPPPGIHTLSAMTTDLDGETFASENRVTLTLLAGLTFEQWRRTSRHFTRLDLERPDISGPLADPDRDRVPNLFEYAWNTNPRRSDATMLPRLERRGDEFVFVCRRRAGGLGPALDLYRYADVLYTIEFSHDLVTWRPARDWLRSAEVRQNGDGVTETVSFTLRGSVEVSGAFFRLRIELLTAL
ncbi:MAG TPA: phage tail protein [Methylomirabilota bacterium]|nr:phage tail protein [Methylomirabilota bacterium]